MLYLLQHLRARFPTVKGSSGHRLFISAFMFASNVTTLQGHLMTRLGEALERSSGMTLSRADLVLSGFMRSVQQCKVIPLVA